MFVIPAGYLGRRRHHLGAVRRKHDRGVPRRVLGGTVMVGALYYAAYRD